MVVNTANDSVVQRLDYHEFGVVTLNTNPGFQPVGFAGGLYDERTGFVRFGVRDYDADTGRWTDKDPLGFGRGHNLLQYVNNDPANVADISGLFSASECGGSLASCPVGDVFCMKARDFLTQAPYYQ